MQNGSCRNRRGFCLEATNSGATSESKIHSLGRIEERCLSKADSCKTTWRVESDTEEHIQCRLFIIIEGNGLFTSFRTLKIAFLTLQTTSEPGPLYNVDAGSKSGDNASPHIPATDSQLTTNNESSWSLLHATAPAPSPLITSNPNSNTTARFYSDSSCASMNIPSPPGSSANSSGGSGRPSHHPIMGTSLYASGGCPSGFSIHRSCTFPNSSPAVPRMPRPSAQNPTFENTSGRTLVSVETQTSREQVTELDEVVLNGDPKSPRNSQRHRQRHRHRHLYINILDEFEPGNLKLSSWSV